MKLLLIWNPAAGRGKTRRHAREVEAYLRSRGASVDAIASTSADDLTKLAFEGSRAGYDRVVICGGDGSLNLALRRFDLTRGTLALIPFGSGNDFARVCSLPRTLRAACDVALGGEVATFDVAAVNGTRYLGVAGVGFDSEVARYAAEVRFLRGSLIYLYAIFRVLPRFEPHGVRIIADGAEADLEIMFAVVANTGQYGGGIRIAPGAHPDDGELDLCIVHRTSRVQLLKTLPLAYAGRHVGSPFVEIRRVRQVRIESTASMDVYADGECVAQTPAGFRLENERLRIVVATRR